MNELLILLLLLAAHYLADYPLQPQYMVDAKAKRTTEGDHALFAHAVIVGAVITFVAWWFAGADDSALVYIFLLNAVSHWFIDFGKARRHAYGLNIDQFMHLLVLVWTWIALI